MIDDEKESLHITPFIAKIRKQFNLRIEIQNCQGETQEALIVKQAYFSRSESKNVSENWHETYIKFDFPLHAVTWTGHSDLAKVNPQITFYISDSEFLSARCIVHSNYKGELKREIATAFYLEKNLSHLGLENISSSQYIGERESNILKVTPTIPIVSFFKFFKRLKPVIEYLLLLASFAERRRLGWIKCNGFANQRFVEIYNTRQRYYSDKRTVPLISIFNVEKFLSKTLTETTFADLHYKANLIEQYQSGIDFSVEAQIVLWNAILEKILKTKYGEKNDKLKEALLKRMGIPIEDLGKLSVLIDARNDVAHGDKMSNKSIFSARSKWNVLIERVILKELGWTELKGTDVRRLKNGAKGTRCY